MIKDSDALVNQINEIYHQIDSEFFDKEHKERHQMESRFWKFVGEEFVSKHKGSLRVIDVCTGTGFVPSILSGYLGEKDTLVCTDISHEMIKKTACKVRSTRPKCKVEFFVSNSEYLPVRKGCFDIVMMNAALHHLPKYECFLKGVDNILKKGGVFCLGHEPNRSFYTNSSLMQINDTVFKLLWYTSPTNIKNKFLKIAGKKALTMEERVIIRLNDILLEKDYVDRALSVDEVREIVDVHSKKPLDERGFDIDHLMAIFNNSYEKIYFDTINHSGMPTYNRLVVSLIETLLKRHYPNDGQLFNVVMRK